MKEKKEVFPVVAGLKDHFFRYPEHLPVGMEEHSFSHSFTLPP
jgi:hypothetical protein